MTSQNKSASTGREYKGGLMIDVRKVTLLRLNPWFVFSTHIQEITFKLFLINTYSLDHEKWGGNPDIRFS